MLTKYTLLHSPLKVHFCSLTDICHNQNIRATYHFCLDDLTYPSASIIFYAICLVFFFFLSPNLSFSVFFLFVPSLHLLFCASVSRVTETREGASITEAWVHLPIYILSGRKKKKKKKRKEEWEYSRTFKTKCRSKDQCPPIWLNEPVGRSWKKAAN